MPRYASYFLSQFVQVTLYLSKLRRTLPVSTEIDVMRIEAARSRMAAACNPNTLFVPAAQDVQSTLSSFADESQKAFWRNEMAASSTTPSVESFQFQAETTRLLHLMIHSLYTQREIFLRELISNASDALDRLRFEALTNPQLLPADHEYEIHLKPDPVSRTLTISDSGIGMDREELIANIGTIAQSGTGELRRRMTESQSAQASAELIGQFGVGFYSAFMVADKVTIVTRRAGQTFATRWESSGDGAYTLTPAEKATCGTDITLFLKQPDAETGIEDYADRWKLTMIVHKYSDFIPYPIVYQGPAQEPGEPSTADGEVASVTHRLNSLKPIWTRNRSEVTESDYAAFYKRVTNDWNEPLKVLPLKAEGTLEFSALLFVPSQAPYDLFYHAAETGLRLYAKRVMVMEKCEELLPKYLRFIQGVVDSSELPLNISRQRLQQERQIAQIRKWLTRKVLDALAEMQEKEPAKFLKFWGQFGRALKEGVASDYDNGDRLLPLLLFDSSHDPKELTSLKDYVARMKPEQNEIFYLTGESRIIIEHCPHLQASRQAGYEVLYLSDPVDELLVQHLHEFEGKHLKTVAKGTFQLGTEEEKKQRQEILNEKEEGYANFLEACQKKLDPYIKRVRLSARLVDAPVCLVNDEHEYSPHLERMLQKGNGGGAKQRRIMELNPDHAIVTRLYQRFQSNGEDEGVSGAVELLYELALLAEGSEIGNPVRMNLLVLDLLQKNL
jgi:molecular chaperone HtpG